MIDVLQERPRCKAIRADGQYCQSFTLLDSDYCHAHSPDPEVQERFAEGRRLGGLRRHGRHIGRIDAQEPVTVSSPADVLVVLEQEFNSVLGLERSLSRARTLATLSDAFGKVWAASELQARLDMLEGRDEDSSGNSLQVARLSAGEA